MKIAVASMDGVGVSPHFGRSACFVFFDVKEGKIAGKETRSNSFTPHARGECTGEHEKEHSHSEHAHGHTDIIGALKGCDALLCGGMGWRAAEDLKANGIQAMMVDPASTAEEAIMAFIQGKITGAGDLCHCHQ